MDDIDQIIDRSGHVRRLGSLAPPEGFVSSFRTFEAEMPLYDDDEIRTIITDPGRVPLRRVFPSYWITDQKSHGSCNGFAGAAALSKARWLRGIRDKMILSGAFLYSLINGGRDNGSMLEDGLREVQKTGICPASLVGWDAIYPKQQPANARSEAAKHKGMKCYAVQTKQGFRSALAAGFPVIVAVQAGGNFQRLNAQGIAGVDSGGGNHAIHSYDIEIIGGKEYYLTDNSWGTSYGQSGRCLLAWESFAQTFGRHTFYAIASTEEID